MRTRLVCFLSEDRRSMLMEQYLNEKAMEINDKREKRGNPLFFLKDLVEYTGMLLDRNHASEAEYVFSEAVEAYLNHGLDGLVIFHVYADFGIADRLVELSDRIYGTDSAESLGIVYYRAIDVVDSGNRTDETEVYEQAINDLNGRKHGYVEEKLKLYRRYTSTLRREGRADEARELEDKLIQFKSDGVWPLG